MDFRWLKAIFFFSFSQVHDCAYGELMKLSDKPVSPVRVWRYAFALGRWAETKRLKTISISKSDAS